MVRNDRRAGARRFASPRFALASPRRVTKNAQRFVYDCYLQIANFRSTTTTSDYNYFVWDPTEKVATRPLVWNFSTIQPFNSSTAYYTHDGNKNVSDVIAADGSLAAHYDYAPFGAVIKSTGAENCPDNPSTIHYSLLPIRYLNPWRFSSEFADDELGCDYFNYREYEPVRGRWLAFDLAGENWTCNLYSFIDNAPICLFDLLGLKRRRCEFIVYAGHYDYVTNKIAIANNDILEHHNSSDRKWYGAVSCFSDRSNAQIEQSGNLALIPGMPSNRDLLYFYEKDAKDTHGVYSRDAMESALEAAVKAAKQLCICGTCDKVSIFFICDEEMERVEKKNILLHGRPSWQKQNPGKSLCDYAVQIKLSVVIRFGDEDELREKDFVGMDMLFVCCGVRKCWRDM